MLTEERKFACAQTSIARRTILQQPEEGGTRAFADPDSDSVRDSLLRITAFDG